LHIAVEYNNVAAFGETRDVLAANTARKVIFREHLT
jgi:hypothetical protein